MIIKEYRIKRIANSDEDPIEQWQIHLQLAPTWFERTFLGRIFTENRTMIGSYMSWEWGDGSSMDYFWKFWAFNTIQTHIDRTGVQPMSTVALIDKKMNETIKLVETQNPQFTIDSLMRNRDPRQFIAREVDDNPNK